MLDDIAYIRESIRINRRHLQKLELKRAVYGEAAAPAYIDIEIEDIEKKIKELEQKLKTLGIVDADQVATTLTNSVSVGQIDHLTVAFDEESTSVSTNRFVDPNSISFINRLHEVELITHPSRPPYVLIDAPAGYGKSRLLRQIQSWYREKRVWECILVDFSADEHQTSLQDVIDSLEDQLPNYRHLKGRNLDEHINHVVRTLKANKKLEGIILLFDSVEKLTAETAQQLLHEVVIRIFQELEGVGFFKSGRKFRAVFAGRHVANSWKNLAHGRLPLDVRSLGPFDLNAIIDTVRTVVREIDKDFPDENIRDISYHIMRFTGGHPGCIATIISELANTEFVGWKRYFAQRGQDHIYWDIVEPVIQEVKRGIPKRLHLAFETLSVFRRFSYETIRYLLNRGEIQWKLNIEAEGDPAWKLYSEIKATGLVNWNEGFFSDDIVRRLLAIEIREEEADLYRQLCNCAEESYDELLAGSQVKNPYLLAIERAYQQLQSYKFDPSPAKEQMIHTLSTTLADYLDRAKTYADRQERLWDLEQALALDWEWQYSVIDVLGPEAFQEILGRLKQHASP
jgi:hypothetical protein